VSVFSACTLSYVLGISLERSVSMVSLLANRKPKMANMRPKDITETGFLITQWMAGLSLMKNRSNIDLEI